MGNDRALRRAIVLAALLPKWGTNDRMRDWCVDEARRLEELLNPPDPAPGPDPVEVIRATWYRPDPTSGL